MTELRFTVDAPVPAERVIEALTDFSDRRPDLWPELDPDAYRVEELGVTSALVREGQRKPRLWALEEYDWSTPGTVTWTARESSFCAPGSFMSARVEPLPNGGSRMHVTWSRKGVGLKGRMVVGLMRLTRGQPLAKSLSRALAGLPQATDAGG
ncbi:MAG TPA: SRPBCC family protein [Actinomycetota bacterium]